MTAWHEDALDLDGVPLSWSRRGQGSPGIIVLHGQLGDRAVVQPLVETVADRRVVVPDLRGRGRTVCREVGLHTWERYVTDVKCILDHLELESVVVAGVSFGTGLAVATALTHPDRVDALVLWASPYRGRRHGWSAGQRAIQGPLIEMAGRALDQGAASVIAGEDPHTARRWNRHDPESIAAALVGIGWSQPFDDLNDLGAISVRTLVIAGSDALHDPELANAYVGALPRGSAGQETPTVIADFAATL